MVELHLQFERKSSKDLVAYLSPWGAKVLLNPKIEAYDIKKPLQI